MYGPYTAPFKVEAEGISVSASVENGILLYHREILDDTFEKPLLCDCTQFLIEPVEPVNLPENLTEYFLIEFEQGVLVKPYSKHILFLKIPVEIGVFIGEKNEFISLDVFSLNKAKYTLYGDVKSGKICRYWKSAVYTKIPETNPLQEGVMRLNLKNRTNNWLNVTRIIVNAHPMTMYYDKNLVAVKAKIRLMDEEDVLATAIDAPLKPKMKRALELYTRRAVTTKITKFMIEGELV